MIELEYKYVRMVNELERIKKHPHWSDILWRNKYVKKLKSRLESLRWDTEKGLVNKKAFEIWESMIENAIKK